MKKIMKAFAAIAALAMVSSGFVACSDDEEEDTSPSISIKADSALTVAAGENFSVDATLTLKNDSFAGDIPQGVSLNTFIEDWIVTDEDDFVDDPLVVSTEAAAEGSKILKINISGTAADVASTKNGTIKIKLAADAVKSGKSLTTNAIKYQFTVAGGNGGGDSEVLAKTYNFAGLGFSDFPANSLTQKSNGTSVLTELGSETQPYFAVGTWTVADATVKATNSKRISARFTNEATTAVNIGNSNMSSATSAAADNYIKITAPGAGTVKMTYKITASTASDKVGATDATAALTSDSAVLASNTYDTTYDTYSALTDEQKTANYNNQVLETTVTAGQEVYVGYFRGTGAGTGNIDVYKIEFTPAAN